MELKDPRITVQNTNGKAWQVTAEGLTHGEHNLERVDFTVLVDRSDMSVPALTREAIKRAIHLLQQHLESSPSK